MGKKLIIKDADFSVNGLNSREKIVLIKNAVTSSLSGQYASSTSPSQEGWDWYTTGRLQKESNTYVVEGANGAQARFIKIKDNAVSLSAIITLPATLDLSDADEFALNFRLATSNPSITAISPIDVNLLDDIFLYPI